MDAPRSLKENHTYHSNMSPIMSFNDFLGESSSDSDHKVENPEE